MKCWNLVVATAVAVLAACGTEPTRISAPETVARNTSTPLSLNLMGPTEVPPGVSCIWVADVTGGTPPYTFGWNSSLPNPNQPYWYTASFTSIAGNFVKVTVEDATGAELTTTIAVSARSYVDQCYS